jgi:hypothetical protein
VPFRGPSSSAYRTGAPYEAAAPVPVSVADTAAAADALQVSAAVPFADTAAAADALAVSASVPLADTAAAADALASGSPVSFADTAAAADALAVSVSVPLSDTAAAADAAANITPTPTDTAAAADKLAAAVAVPLADTAAAADALTVSTVVPLKDTAAAADALTVAGAVPLKDTAAAADALVSAAGGPPTLGGVLPGNVGNQVNPPGYQGGPSGGGAVVPSAVGNSWEIYVYSGLDYTTLLAVIPNSMLLNFQFARQLDDIGSGTVVLSQDDPWWAHVTLPGGLPTETLLDEECLWQFRKDGVPRFEFLGETITEQLVDPSEQRQVTVTGPGTIAALKWAMIAPQGFPDIVLKLDGILDSFDEVDVNGNGVVDTNIWTTVSPAGHVYITPIANIYSYPGGVGYNLGTLFPSGSLTIGASPGTTYLGASPYDATDTLISAQVTPIGVTANSTDSTTPAAYGTGLNGSELTQFYIQSNFNSANYALFGLSGTAFYVQAGNSGQVSTKILPAYDSTAHAYWMITEQAGSGGGSGTFYFWTSPDGQAWTLQWTYIHSWDATNVSFFVTATYSVDATESVQITNLNSNVTTPSYQGSLYLGIPLMGVWLDQFSRARARGTIPFVTSQVTAAADTYGRPWSDVQNVQAVNGTDMYSFLQSATSVVNADYVMDPGFQLRVGQPATGQVALGVDRSGYLVLREGYDSASKQRVRARNQIQTLIGGENADGHEISAFSPAFISEWGQREGWFQAAVQVDPTSMAFASAAALAQNETEILSWTFNLVPNLPGKTVFDNFDVGDWLGLERPNFSAVDPVRVMGIAVSVDNAGSETHELTFVSYIQWLAEQLTYLSNKLGGAFVNSLGTSPVAPSKYGTGQVPTYFTPAATLAGLADVAGNTGSAMSTAPLVYNPATGQYQPAGSTDPVTGQMVPVTVATAGGSATLSDTTVVVNTGAGSTVVGLQGDGTVTTVDAGGSAPAAPDTPVAAGIVQGLVAAWDGLLAGAAPLSNFQHVLVHVGTSSGFTPSGATQVGTLVAGGVLTVSGLTAGSTYYVKLVAVTTAGVSSPPSAAASAVAAGVPTSLLTGQLPASLIGNSAGSALNPNPFFNGGDLTGWFVTNGTLSAATPPAGAPGAAQFAAKVVSTSANCLISGSTAPFPVTPGQPYAMTAWVYNPGGSAVNVALGFNWTSGTVTVSVSPGTWVPVTTVQTCPGGVTSAYQVIGPTGSGVTLYVLGAVAAGQVPGQLLAANSVAAQQIAANTITATQIAANTITAAQIAANTITAGQIAASTITAAQIAAATITAAQISANTITAAQIAAGTITGTQIAASISLTSPSISGGTITGGTVIADGSSGEILVYSSTPATGNLFLSVSAVSGTDGFSNAYGSGLEIYSTGGSKLQLSDNGTAAVIQGFSGGATEVSPTTLSMAVFNQGLANENIQMQFRGPESSFDSSAVSIIMASSAADGSSGFTGTLEANASSAAGWGAGSLGTQFNITHQLLIGGATGGSQVEMSGDIHVGGNILIGSGSIPQAVPSTAGAVAAQGTWSSGQQAWAASITTVVNNLRAQLLLTGVLH